MIPKSKIELTIYNENFQVDQRASSLMAFRLIDDLTAYHGEEAGKDAWWMVYKELRKQLKYD